MLLGKNSKKLRIISAHLLKALFESNQELKKPIFSYMSHKLGTLKTYGVNTHEFLSVFSFIVLSYLELDKYNPEFSTVI